MRLHKWIIRGGLGVLVAILGRYVFTPRVDVAQALKDRTEEMGWLWAWFCTYWAHVLLSVCGIAFLISLVPWDRWFGKPTESKDKPKLEFEYTPAKIIGHPNGFIEARLLLWNRGTVRAQRVRVVLVSLEPLDSTNTAYSGQFPCRLQVEGKDLGFDLQAGEPVDVRVIKGGKGSQMFLVDGYSNDAGNQQRQTFRVNSGSYRMTITATSLHGKPDKKHFLVSQDANGFLSFNEVV